MIHQSSGFLRQFQRQGRQSLTDCPVTGEQAKKLTENRIVIPNGQANWWHCSVCQGWHIKMVD